MFIVLVCLFMLIGCSTKEISNNKQETICLVLSMGGSNTVSHAGAIDALDDLGYKFDYIYGNGAASLVASMYARNPKANMKNEIYNFINAYKSIGKEQRKRVKGMLGLFGLIAYSNPLWGLGLYTLSDIKDYDYKRYQETLSHFFGMLEINSLDISLGMGIYDSINNKMIGIQSGSVTENISKSCAHSPYFKVFKINDIDEFVIDRVSKTPIFESYEMFKPDQIIAVNVSGDEPFSPKISSTIDIINVSMQDSKVYCHEELIEDSLKPCVDKMYELGYDAVINYFKKK